MQEDIWKFCENLLVESEEKKTKRAFNILNEIPQLETFLDQFFRYENGFLSDDSFLNLLMFGVEYMRLPFILYLNCPEFCQLIETKFQRLGSKDQILLKTIFSKMFEKFLNYETIESNVDNVDLLCAIYQKIFETDSSNYIKIQLKSKNSSQNILEKMYNSAKVQLKKAISIVESEEYLHNYENFSNFLRNIKINTQICQNSSEIIVIKKLIDEKEMLINVINVIIRPPVPSLKPQINMENLPPEKCTSFFYLSHLSFLEDIEMEYKNYFFPLGDDQRKTLRKTICAFLNTNGGRIYIGIRDDDQCVFGLELTTKEKDQVILTIDDLLREIHPKVKPDECITKFVPLKDERGKYMAGFFVVKIIVKRGNLNELYFTKLGGAGFPYERRPGKNQIIEVDNLAKIIIERNQIPSYEIKKNLEYNAKFNDIEPEIGENKLMKMGNRFNQPANQLYLNQKKINKLSRNVSQNEEVKVESENQNIQANKPHNVNAFSNASQVSSNIIYLGIKDISSEVFEKKLFSIFKQYIRDNFQQKVNVYLSISQNIIESYFESDTQLTANFLLSAIRNII